MRKLAYILLSLLLVACLLPIAGPFWAEAFAARHGCTVHGGFATSCIVDGVDRGPDLTRAFNAAWILLLSLPVGIGAALALIWLPVSGRRRPPGH
ncbi:MAG: hypothetical protein JJ938_08770 [Roseicyclus sp.]|nr:hypothetical protein [Roseicyclus sp.]MBO6624960.1 hypothetical protein [Roseicyclus sp.]MBO6921908.1 hypothetical protein [Roseicyclus sp.]